MWCESTPRTASVNPQPMPSSGTSNGSHVLVRPARTSASAFSMKCERRRRRVGLEVGAGPVALDGVRPLRDLPLERHLGLQRRLRQVDDARCGRSPSRSRRGRRGPTAPSTRGGRSGRRRCRGRGGPCRRTSAATSPSCTCRRSRASGAAGSCAGSTGGGGRPGCRAGPWSRTSPGLPSRRRTSCRAGCGCRG